MIPAPWWSLLAAAEETALGRVCLVVGTVLLVTDVLMPLLFRRRVRLVWPRRRWARQQPPQRPWLRLPRPPTPLSRGAFRRRHAALEAEIRVLTQAIARRTAVAVEKDDDDEEATGPTARLGADANNNADRNSRGPSRRRNHGQGHVRGDDTGPVAFQPPLSEGSRHVTFADTIAVRAPADHREPVTETNSTSPPPTTTAATAPAPPQMTMTTTFSTTSSAGSYVSPVEAFEFVQDDFPWRLPSYATAPSTDVGSRSTSLPVRRRPVRPAPLAPAGGSSQASTLLHAAAARARRVAASPTIRSRPAASLIVAGASSKRRRADAAASSSRDPLSIADPRGESDERATDRSQPPTPLSKRTHEQAFGSNHRLVAPSPRPPLHPKSHASKSTQLVSSPPLQRPKLRTPQIVRRIAFDDAMMALATPEVPRLVETSNARKRTREEVEDEAVRSRDPKDADYDDDAVDSESLSRTSRRRRTSTTTPTAARDLPDADRENRRPLSPPRATSQWHSWREYS